MKRVECKNFEFQISISPLKLSTKLLQSASSNVQNCVPFGWFLSRFYHLAPLRACSDLKKQQNLSAKSSNFYYSISRERRRIEQSEHKQCKKWNISFTNFKFVALHFRRRKKNLIQTDKMIYKKLKFIIERGGLWKYFRASSMIFNQKTEQTSIKKLNSSERRRINKKGMCDVL